MAAAAARECSSVVIGRVVGNSMDGWRGEDGAPGGVCQGLWVHQLRFSFLLTVVFYCKKKSFFYLKLTLYNFGIQSYFFI